MIPTFRFTTPSYNYYKYINAITIPFKCVMGKTLIGYKIKWGFRYHTEYMGPARPKRSDHPFYPMKQAKNWKKSGI